jgi:hypothetical protein
MALERIWTICQSCWSDQIMISKIEGGADIGVRPHSSQDLILFFRSELVYCIASVCMEHLPAQKVMNDDSSQDYLTQ